MPGSFCCVHIHAVFGTKHRVPFLADVDAARLHEYLGGILRRRGCLLVGAGSVADHVHLLFRLAKDQCLSDVMRDVKSNSSHWLRRTPPQMSDFAWQEGYATFGVGIRGVPQVLNYLAGQHAHHRERTFQEEYVAFLVEHGIEFDPKHLWDDEHV